jgi:hypothetical protein
VAALLAACALAGCGGGGDKTGAGGDETGVGGDETFTRAETETCLTNAGATIQPDVETFVEAGIASISAELPENAVSINLERSETDAKNVVRAWENVAEGLDVDTEDLIRRLGTVVIVWDKSPTSEERAAVEGCFE